MRRKAFLLLIAYHVNGKTWMWKAADNGHNRILRMLGCWINSLMLSIFMTGKKSL